ncbi:MAG: hypothetical protein GYB38_05970 [Gammaproteobacteria bacterium]|nr:hypothetical protein [Gammaproteobacteria bacterium]
MKKIAVLGLVVALGGCANHANIEMPAVTQVYHESFENKSISYEIMYSQPKPGVFSGGEQMPLVPLEQAEFSVASAATLRKLPDYIYQQLPPTVKRLENGQGDFKLVVELTAYDKKGLVYSDHEFAKSFGKNLLTLGFASSEYDIIADFDAKYKLYSGDKEIFVESYNVQESVDHERGDFDSFNSLNDYAGQLLEKHLILTLNDFFKKSTTKI